MNIFSNYTLYISQMGCLNFSGAQKKKRFCFLRFSCENVKVLFIQFETNEKDQQSAKFPLYFIS